MASKTPTDPQKDAYDLILDAIDQGVYRPGDRLVESELADRFGVSRTPIREALQRLETQSLLARDGRSLIVASLDHAQMAELYAVRQELEGLAAKLAAQHAAIEEIEVLRDMVQTDRDLLDDPQALARAAQGRGEKALAEHGDIVEAIAARDGDRAARALKEHLSIAFVVRLKEEAETASGL
jgi:DNA-binding GntR family transcriptional regulator